MRLFTLPVPLLKDLRRGAPGLADALARAMALGEDPEIFVAREEHTDRPTTWTVLVESESVYESMAIDSENYAAVVVAIGVHLIDLMRGINRDHPWVIREMDVEGMLLDLVRRERQRPS